MAATHVSVIAGVTVVLRERTTLAPLLYSHAETEGMSGHSRVLSLVLRDETGAQIE